MRYIDQSLADGEVILQRGKWPAVFWMGAWAALILLGIIVVGVFIFLTMAIKMSTTDFAVTNRRVILKRGWLNRRTQELAVGSVEGVSLDQSLIPRMFGYGRVIVTGTGEATIVFPPMAHPVAFRRAIETARARGEVHLAHEDIEALRRAQPEQANENEAPEQHPDERSRKHGRSFIGLRTRR